MSPHVPAGWGAPSPVAAEPVARLRARLGMTRTGLASRAGSRMLNEHCKKRNPGRSLRRAPFDLGKRGRPSSGVPCLLLLSGCFGGASWPWGTVRDPRAACAGHMSCPHFSGRRSGGEGALGSLLLPDRECHLAGSVLTGRVLLTLYLPDTAGRAPVGQSRMVLGYRACRTARFEGGGKVAYGIRLAGSTVGSTADYAATFQRL